MSPGHLSLILAGKRKVKAQTALRLADRLGVTPSETVQLLREESPSRARAKIQVLSTSEFRLIGQWYNFAILGLADLTTNVALPQWIAKRLHLPLEPIKSAFQELLALGYLKIHNGQFRQVPDPLRTEDDVPSQAVRRYHKQNLQLAIEKIDLVPPHLREFVSLTLAISPKRVGAAKKMIRKFKEEFADELCRGQKSEVYNLNIQFFPVTVTKQE